MFSSSLLIKRQKQIMNNEMGDSKSTYYMCNLCQKKFRGMESMNYHIKNHISGSPSTDRISGGKRNVAVGCNNMGNNDVSCAGGGSNSGVNNSSGVGLDRSGSPPSFVAKKKTSPLKHRKLSSPASSSHHQISSSSKKSTSSSSSSSNRHHHHHHSSPASSSISTSSAHLTEPSLSNYLFLFSIYAIWCIVIFSPLL